DQRLDRTGSYRRNPRLRHVRLDGLKPLQTPGQCLTEPLQVAKHDVRRQIWLSSQFDADRDPKSLATGESKDGTRSRHLAYRTGQILNFTPCGQPQWRVGTRTGDLQQVVAESQSSIRWMPSHVNLAAWRSCRPRIIRACKSPRRLVSSSRRLVTTTRNARQPEMPKTSARNSLRRATPRSTAPQRKPEKL